MKAMARRFFVTQILATVIVTVAIAHAGDSDDPVLGRLAKVGRFAFGGTGFAGVISRGERDFRRIQVRPSAEADFEKLLAVGNPQAKAYALVGLRHLDTKRFKQLSASLRGSTEEVVTQHGCIVSQESFGTILKNIDAGAFLMYVHIAPTSPEPGVDP
jgi:hypothetical protein